MKKKIIPLVIISFVALWILAGCAKPNWECKDFKYLGESAEKGPIFEVGGITYCYLPETFWIAYGPGDSKYLGWVSSEENVYPGGGLFDIYSYEADDVNKTFVELYSAEKQELFSESRPFIVYHRSDVTLPPFDRTAVNKLEYLKKGGLSWEKKPVTQDTGIIDKLFDSIGSVSQGYDIYKSYPTGSIMCMDSNYPGIAVQVSVDACGQDYWLIIKPPERGFSDNWSVVENIKPPEAVYAKISQELLEQIAGQKLPTPSEYIASQQKTAS